MVVGAGELAEGRIVAAHGDDLSIGKIQCEAAGLSGPPTAVITERLVIGYKQGSA